MKNPFIFSYAGNKRNEIEDIYKHLDFSNITTIIETNSGSCVMSYYIAKLNPKKYKYILNDIDKILFKLYNILKDIDKTNELNSSVNILADKFNEFKTDDERRTMWKHIESNKDIIENYVFFRKYANQSRMCPLFSRAKQLSKFDANQSPTVEFFRTEDIEFNNINDVDILEKYKDCKDCLFLIDPPYLQTYNSFYQDKDMNIYQYLVKNSIKKAKSKIYLVLEENWIIDLIFKDANILLRKDKTYQISKKKTSHYVITNQKIK